MMFAVTTSEVFSANGSTEAPAAIIVATAPPATCW